MKVMHVLYDNIFSGAQNVVCQIVDLFKEYESDTEMIYVSPDGPIREALKEREIRFYALNRLTVNELKKVIREEKPDVIHAHDMRASVIAALACGRLPLVSHIHNNNYNSRNISMKSVLYCLAALKAKHIFWVSRSSQDGFAFQCFFRKKSSVLYNVIDRNKVHEYALKAELRDSYNIIYVGRLTYQKNPERLIRVFSGVAKADPRSTMAIVGNGELSDSMREMVEQLPTEIKDRISLLGYLKNPYGIMEKAKVMLMTSRWEGTPMCVLEAQEFGVPLVSTPSDGIKDIIRHGENGYLESDDKELSRRCITLLTNPDKHQLMSEAAKEFSRKYNDRRRYFDMISGGYQKAIRLK